MKHKISSEKEMIRAELKNCQWKNDRNDTDGQCQD